jgi:hypothetical protein
MELDYLFKLRLVVARYGEMDNAKWWNTKGQLGRLGTAALSRGFPRTHHFAQARSVFAVASHRCAEVFDPPGSVTLWRLKESIEEEFEARWEYWIDQAAEWEPMFKRLEAIQETTLTGALQEFSLADQGDIARVKSLRLTGSGLSLSAKFSATDDDVKLLALGFARGDLNTLVVPHMASS